MVRAWVIDMVPREVVNLVLSSTRDLGGSARRRDIINRAVELGHFTDDELALPPRYKRGTYGGHVKTIIDYAVWEASQKGLLVSTGEPGTWRLTAEGAATTDKTPPDPVGIPYVAADEEQRGGGEAVAVIDLDRHDRAQRVHAELQNRVAALVQSCGLAPLSPIGSPEYDLAFRFVDRIVVAEIKSLPVGSEEQQLRIGLGQVLRYRQQLTATTGATVEAILVVERSPSDKSWFDAFRSSGVMLFEGGSLETELSKYLGSM